MLSKATGVRSGSMLSLNSVIGMVLPGRLQQKIILSVAILCLVSVIITLTISAQSNRVLLVSSAVPIQQAMTSKAGTVPAASKVSFANASVTASKVLMRIDQLDPGQYASQQEYTTWAYSTCSTASMTEVMNSYGHTYRIADILKVEAGIHEITPDLGLLEPTGIDRTVARFGFQTDWLSNSSLDTVIKVANQGHPVIVGFPPALWSGGHLLVVRGGNSQDVYLADSSRLNMQVMARATFMKYWAGFAVVVSPKTAATQPTGSYSVLGKPTISAAFINRVLASYNSPAAGKGQVLYNLGINYGIDPAFALAFFMHESSFGTQGVARFSLSLGNLRCISNFKCLDGYAWFPTWESGFEAWYSLIRTLYVSEWKLTTVSQIIPKYAPAADNNDEAAYIASVEHSIATWRTGTVMVNS